MNDQKILDAVIRINGIFGLEKQAKELVSLITRYIRSEMVCCLFLDETGERLNLLACKPSTRGNQMAEYTIDAGHPSLKEFLKSASILTEEEPLASRILSAIELKNGDTLDLGNIGMIAPMVSSSRLVGFVLVANREEEAYTLEERNLVHVIVSKLAPGFEKEYLRDRLSEREQELSVLNACCSVLSSSLDLADVFHSFVKQVKDLVDVDWTAVLLTDDDQMSVLAIYSDIGLSWEPGEIMPVKGSATEWVTATRLPLVESDLVNDSLFVTDVYHRKQGIRSIACLPLLVHSEEAIGCLIIGSRKPNRYNPRQMEFLRVLASQMAMPVKNARLYAEVLKKSRYDGLTSLLNRRTMDEQIANEVLRHSRYGGVFSMILLDLDSMKIINDHYGHLAGDGLLSRTGSIIKEAIRGVDQAFRYGGDEFAIMLPNTSSSAAVKVSERIRKRIASRLIVDDMIVTASFGLASWPESGMEPNDIVASADAALYRAKNQGGNCTCFSDSPNNS